MSFTDRLRRAWNAFANDKANVKTPIEVPIFSSNPQYRSMTHSRGSILNTIINRIAIDVSLVEFEHVRYDDSPDTEDVINDGLQECLSLSSNLDQTNTDFFQDLVLNLMDLGVVAVVAVDCDVDPDGTGGFEVLSLRVGRITSWYPKHVQVELYNELTGKREQIIVSKSTCAIIQNPLYEVVNSPNSTLKRLARKISLLDAFDDSNSNAKMDLILQLPYTVKTDIRKREAEQRIKMMEDQLKKSKYGIAYVDATERVTQLNRAVENTLLKEIEYLTQELFNQLGMTMAVFNGTAGESERRAYYDVTINPIAKRISAEFTRKFFTRTAVTQGHRVVYHTDLFSLVPVEQLASSLDTLRRNEIITTNEARRILGYRPSDDPRANKLSNPNIADVNQMDMEIPEDFEEEMEKLGEEGAYTDAQF